MKNLIKKVAVFGIGILFSSLCFSQKSISGIIKDVDSKMTIPFANILNLADETGTISNGEGIFDLSVKQLPARLQISFIGYKTDTILVENYDRQEIFLKIDNQNLPTIEVSSNRKFKSINTGIFSPHTFVAWKDFVFLLSKNGTFGNYQIETFDNRGNFIKKHELDIGKIQDLQVCCMDKLYVSNKQFSIALDYSENQLIPVDKMSNQDFEKFFDNCRCSNESDLFYELKMKNGLLKRYVKADKTTGDLQLLKEIQFGNRIESYAQDAAFISSGDAAHNMGDLSVCESEKIRHGQQDSYFLETVFHKNSVENHLFTFNDEIIFFNNDEQKIEFFNLNGEPIHSVKMQLDSNEKREEKSIILDSKTEKFYTISQKQGKHYLAQINLKTGGLFDEYLLKVKSYKKVEIIDDLLFVLGVPEDSESISRNELLIQNVFSLK